MVWPASATPKETLIYLHYVLDKTGCAPDTVHMSATGAIQALNHGGDQVSDHEMMDWIDDHGARVEQSADTRGAVRGLVVTMADGAQYPVISLYAAVQAVKLDESF